MRVSVRGVRLRELPHRGSLLLDLPSSELIPPRAHVHLLLFIFLPVVGGGRLWMFVPHRINNQTAEMMR